MDLDEQTNNAPLQPGQENTEVVIEDPSDRLTPEHPRFKEVLQRAKTAEEKYEQIQAELESLKAKVETRQDATGDEYLTAEEQQYLNFLKKELRKEGFVTQDVLASDRQAIIYDKLQDKFDGKNGYPKFDPVDVTAYAKRNGYGSNYEAAYNAMHHSAIVEVEAKRFANKPTPPAIEKPSGKEGGAPQTELTLEDVANMSDDEYAAKSDEIKRLMKQAVKSADARGI